MYCITTLVVHEAATCLRHMIEEETALKRKDSSGNTHSAKIQSTHSCYSAKDPNLSSASHRSYCTVQVSRCKLQKHICVTILPAALCKGLKCRLSSFDENSSEIIQRLIVIKNVVAMHIHSYVCIFAGHISCLISDSAERAWNSQVCTVRLKLSSNRDVTNVCFRAVYSTYSAYLRVAMNSDILRR